MFVNFVGAATPDVAQGVSQDTTRSAESAKRPALKPVIGVPAILCLVMLLIGWATSSMAGVQIGALFRPYLVVSGSITIISVIGFAFIEVARLASTLEDHPITKLRAKLGARLDLLILPAIIYPIFLSGFTAAKSSISFLVGYTWDRFWADIDVRIFGDDAWRIAHRLVGDSAMPILQWLYTFGWGFALLLIGNAVALYARRRTVGIFFTAMFATWILGGCLMAYAFSAAGPVFADAFDPGLHARLGPIRPMLESVIGDGTIDRTQTYLLHAAYSHIATKGGGISAMPSMHLGAMTIYILAARRTRWLLPAIGAWLVIFFCSAYFGYHYWIDGLIAAVVACLCWTGASLIFERFAALESARGEAYRCIK